MVLRISFWIQILRLTSKLRNPHNIVYHNVEYWKIQYRNCETQQD